MSWNLTEYFWKICRGKIQVSLKSDRNNGNFYMKTNVHLWLYLATFFLGWEMGLFQTGVVQKFKRHILLVDEWKTNLMSLAILFHLLCAQHVSDINISIFGSLRLCWWITTSVVLFSVRCVLELLVWLVFGGVRFAGFSLQNEHHQIPAAPKAPTHNQLRTRRPMW